MRLLPSPTLVPRVWILPVLCALVTGCAGPVTVTPEQRLDPAVSIPPPDYRGPGPHGVTTSEGETRSVQGCKVAWTRYQPDTATVEWTAVLAHGFLRDRATQAGLARHLASWGVPAVAAELCGASLTAARQVRNAIQLRALVIELRLDPVLYVGFSAGGQAALLAAKEDPGTRALVALDPVDVDGLALAAAPQLGRPVYGLTATPSWCNADGNGVAALSASTGARVLQVAGASHCHFEVPLDALCTLVCGGDADASVAGPIQGVVLGLVTAAALAPDTGGAGWWTPGSVPLERLLEAGRVRVLRMP